ncbi:MAG TPA: GNAT family N-acetyltransferase [Chthoniobacterales bacterium]
MEIVDLSEKPELREILARWHGVQWRHLYQGWNAAEAMRLFELEKSEGEIPRTWIALDNERLLGSVSLILDDLPQRPKQNPWLASLLVAKSERGRGVGKRLVEALLAWSDARDIAEIFLFTENRTSFFARFGFSSVEETMQNGHAITVMRRSKRHAADGQ